MTTNNTNVTAENKVSDIEKRLMNTLSAVSANKSNSVNSHEYNLYYKLIKKGIMQKFVNLKSANWIYAEVEKLTEKEYLELKSTDDRHKKIRRYFQNLGVNTGLKETDRQKLIAETKSDLFALLTLSDKKDK